MSIVQTQTTSFKKELYTAVHNLSTDTIKIALYTGNANLNEDTTIYSATNEVAGYTVNTSAVLTGIQQAAVSAPPGNALFKLTLIGSRPLGDINNSGTVTSADSLAYNLWINGANSDTAQVAWIEGTMSPYIVANPVTYAAYLSGSNTGYTTGGQVMTGVAISSSGSVAYANWANVSWSGALTARCALIYNATQGNKSIAVLDFGSDKTSTTTFTITMPANTSTTALIRSSN